MLRVLALLVIVWGLTRLNPASTRPEAERISMSTPEEKRQPISLFFSHPFIILIATALLSGFAVTFVSSELQIRSKEIEVKSAIINQMNDVVSDLIAHLSARTFSRNPKSKEDWMKAGADAYQK
jgi:hypothetical protein